MSREEAMLEYCAAIKEHDVADAQTKDRVKAAFTDLQQHLENGRLPNDLYALGRKQLKGPPQ